MGIVFLKSQSLHLLKSCLHAPYCFNDALRHTTRSRGGTGTRILPEEVNKLYQHKPDPFWSNYTYFRSMCYYNSCNPVQINHSRGYSMQKSISGRKILSGWGSLRDQMRVESHVCWKHCGDAAVSLRKGRPSSSTSSKQPCCHVWARRRKM